MYSVYADDVCIYNDSFMLEDAIIIEPVLTLEANAAGSFELTLPPTNKAYDTVERLKTEIKVKKEVIRNGEKVKDEIWSGRIVSDEKDYWNNRKLICEGELAYLNDSTQPMAEYHENKKITITYNATTGMPTRSVDNTFQTNIETFLGALIANHNAMCVAQHDVIDKQFELGIVDAGGGSDTSLYRYTNYEKTIEAINEKLLDKFSGYLMIRKEGLHRYLDYRDESSLPVTNTQTIDFGKNLVNFVRSWNSEEFATVLLPLGARQDTSPIEALEDYLTVASVNDGSIYVQNDSLVELFGRIVKVIHWDDVTVAQNLKTKADAYLSSQQYDKMTIELSALDLHYLDPTIQAINLYDKIIVKSKPHGLEDGITLPVTKLEIPLDSPENTVFTLGTDIKTNLTDVNNKTSAALLAKIEEQKGSVLDEARADAKEIMTQKTTGYITIESNDLSGMTNAMYISNTPNLSEAQSYWKWYAGGLGHTSDGGDNWDVAISMAGEITANFIKTGTMSADRVRTGILRSENGNTSFNLNTGALTMNKGSININDKFIVNTNGNLTANNATVKGTFFAGSNATANDQWVQLSANGKLIGGKGSNTYGYIDYSAAINWRQSGTTDYGIKMASDCLILQHAAIAIKTDNNDSETAAKCYDGTVRVITGITQDSDKTVHYTYRDVRFIHGMYAPEPSNNN